MNGKLSMYELELLNHVLLACTVDCAQTEITIASLGLPWVWQHATLQTSYLFVRVFSSALLRVFVGAALLLCCQPNSSCTGDRCLVERANRRARPYRSGACTQSQPPALATKAYCTRRVLRCIDVDSPRSALLGCCCCCRFHEEDEQ